MSRENDQGWQDAIDDRSALKIWRNEAYCEGWIRGLQSIIDNLWDTLGAGHEADGSYETAEEFENHIRERLEETERYMEETIQFRDQILGSEDEKNRIQKMAKEIERLRDEIRDNNLEMIHLNGEIDKYANELSEKDKEISSLNDEIQNMMDRSSDKDKIIERLHLTLDGVQDACGYLRNQAKEKDEQIQNLLLDGKEALVNYLRKSLKDLSVEGYE